MRRSPEPGQRVTGSGLRTRGEHADRVGAETTARAGLEDDGDKDVTVAGDERDHVKDCAALEVLAAVNASWPSPDTEVTIAVGSCDFLGGNCLAAFAPTKASCAAWVALPLPLASPLGAYASTASSMNRYVCGWSSVHEHWLAALTLQRLRGGGLRSARQVLVKHGAGNRGAGGRHSLDLAGHERGDKRTRLRTRLALAATLHQRQRRRPRRPRRPARRRARTSASACRAWDVRRSRAAAEVTSIGAFMAGLIVAVQMD